MVSRMATILILQEVPGPLQALRNSLEGKHELIFSSSMTDALESLRKHKVNLIITRVHLEETNVFEFITKVKEDEHLASIPLICFCGKRTAIAKVLGPHLAETVRVFGADKYVDLNNFCSGEDTCDFDRLRQDIEDCLAATQHHS